MRTIQLNDGHLALIQGLKDVSIANPETFLGNLRQRHPDLVIQVIDAGRIAGFDHLELVLRQAWEAKARGQSYAKKFDIDLLMRFACKTQISEAVKAAGVKRGRQDLVLVAIGAADTLRRFSEDIQSLGAAAEDVILRSDEKDRSLIRRYKLSRKFIKATVEGEDALPLLLAEKAALLGVKEE